ncbi:hypothetical protein M407DRAFT_231674 [Tulasnella calospora MUT 4182]|uniref:Carbonic anhydrase n=1 Tax=Tulasnella calospora MUT 4182 TaxID=1051891 RepID=A0A0C3QX43_9AGAM|nr:hypothetical protein M407DRAFT_231674 [Tulasnella calospora MUT 4182]
MRLFSAATLLFSALLASAHPHNTREEAAAQEAAQQALVQLVQGHSNFVTTINKESPGLLEQLEKDGQSPAFEFIGCSDSRVSEGTIFDAEPGTFFTQRNIANQYSMSDSNAQSWMAYGISELGVTHIVVLGHYGCGGVAASIASPAGSADVTIAGATIEAWVQPIRALYENSNRTEIVQLREANAAKEKVEEPEYDEPGFRALVEENAKHSADMIFADPVIKAHYAASAAKPKPIEAVTVLNRRRRNQRPVRRSTEGEATQNVFIHTWVYDIRTGELKDLDHSYGPPGVDIPKLGPLLEQRTAETAHAKTA